MIRIDLQLTVPTSPAMDFSAIAGAAMAGAGQMLTRYPQSEMWEITATWDRARYSVRNALGQTMAKVQAVGRGANILKVGQIVQVCYYNRDRRKPYIKAGLGWADWGSEASLILALWPDCTGNPYCNRGPWEYLVAPTWAGASTEMLNEDGDPMHRFYWGDALQITVETGTEPDLQSLLSFEGVTLIDSHPDTSLPRAAALVTLYGSTGGSAIGFLLREFENNGGWSQSDQWIYISDNPIAAEPTNNAHRRQGYLYYDKESDTYTIAGWDGLLICRRGSETPNTTPWSSIYGSLPGGSSVGCAGAYAISGAYRGVDLDTGSASDCAVDLYSRGDTSWRHVAQVILGDKLSDADIYLGCGDWDPYSSAGDELIQENTRWPYMNGKWMVWIFGQGGEDSFGYPTICLGKLLSINASSGSLSVIHSYTAPLHKKTIKDATTLQAAIESDLTYNGILHVGDWVSIGAGEFSSNQGAVRRDNSGLFASAGYGSDYPPPVGYGTSYAHDLTVWSGIFDDSTDPTTAPTAPRLACASIDLLSDQDSHYPRGVVDGSSYYVIHRESAWLSSETATVDIPITSYEYDRYEDVDSGDFDGGTPGTSIRIYIHTRAMASAGFDYRANTSCRPIVRSYTISGMTGSLDLTREFTDTGYKYYQDPLIWEYGVAGDYIWILASDWTAYDTQELSVILVDKTSLTEVDALSLVAEAGTWDASTGRPQLIVGVDGDTPWAQVIATFSGDWKAVEIRYNSGLEATTIATVSGTSTDNPERFTESINLALSDGGIFWIDSGKNFTVNA